MRLFGKALRVIMQQRQALEALQAENLLLYQQILNDPEAERIKIEYSRWGRDMIAKFIVALDHPEDQEELRDVLHQALIDMSDEVARLEEQVV